MMLQIRNVTELSWPTFEILPAFLIAIIWMCCDSGLLLICNAYVGILFIVLVFRKLGVFLPLGYARLGLCTL
jgi:hypothetical protein